MKKEKLFGNYSCCKKLDTEWKPLAVSIQIQEMWQARRQESQMTIIPLNNSSMSEDTDMDLMEMLF